LARPLLLVQFLLLTCVLIFSVTYHPAANPRGLMAGLTAMIAVSAMGCQFALLRLALPVAPSTAVMTGNLTNTVLSLLDTLWSREPLMEGAGERLRKTVGLVVGFLPAAPRALQRFRGWETGPGYFRRCLLVWRWHWLRGGELNQRSDCCS